MFPDTSAFDQLFEVRLSKYLTDNPHQMRNTVRAAINNGADVLIGGRIACRYAERVGVPAIFLACGEEGIHEACRTAQHLAFALDQEKQKTDELKVILDSTFNSIIHVNASGAILNLNHPAEQMLDCTEQQVSGKIIWTIFPSLSKEILRPVLVDGKEIFPIRIRLHGAIYIASVSPILLDEQYPNGAIVCINEQKQLNIYSAAQRNELRQQGYIAHYRFDTIVSNSQRIRATITQAKRLAKFRTPVIIRGEFGTEKTKLAECIHNADEYSKNAFLHINCGAHTPDETDRGLFGEQGMAYKAQSVLFLDEIDKLSLSTQYKVFLLLSGQHIPDALETYNRPLRVIATTEKDISVLVQEGQFQRDLYYALNTMMLYIPPLRERPEDIEGWVKQYVHTFQKRYGRYIYLTKGAQKLLSECSWTDNLVQLRNLCERIIILSPKRNVDETFIREQLDVVVPE